MRRIISFFKNLRAEYKVVLFILLVLILYTFYSIFMKDMITERKYYSDSFSGQTTVGKTIERETASSISDAVSSDRPVVISPKDMQQRLDTMEPLDGSVKGMELATEVENPTIWIYAINDGERKDDLAESYCKWLHNNGIIASSVTILDEAAKNRGKLIEIGESSCIK